MPDHLGSTSLMTDSSGNAIENTSYEPFGEILSGGDASRYQYEGKEFDSTTGQYDFHFRGYKSEWGKFTQPDTLIQDVYNPQMLNRYSFEINNAWKNIDPDGHIIPLAAAVLLGAAVGATVSVVYQLATKPISEFSGKRVLASTLIGAGFSLGLGMTGIAASLAANAGGRLGTELAIELAIDMTTSIGGEMITDILEEENEDDEDKTNLEKIKKDQDELINPNEIISIAQESGGGEGSTTGGGGSSSGGGSQKCEWKTECYKTETEQICITYCA